MEKGLFVALWARIMENGVRLTENFRTFVPKFEEYGRLSIQI